MRPALDIIIAGARHDRAGRGIAGDRVIAAVAQQRCRAARKQGRRAGAICDHTAYRTARTAQTSGRVGADRGVGPVGEGQEIRSHRADQRDDSVGNAVTIGINRQQGVAACIADRHMPVIETPPRNGDGVAFGAGGCDLEIGDRVAVQVFGPVHEQVDARSTGQGIDTGAAPDCVVIGTAVQNVIFRAAGKVIVPGLSLQGVVVGTAKQVVVVRTAVDQVVSGAADQIVVARIPVDRVLTRAAIGIVDPVATSQAVLILAPIEVIVPDAAIQRIVA